MHVSRKFWFKNIRSASWFSFRYYWAAWIGLLSITAVVLYYLFKLPKKQNIGCNQTSLTTIDEINRALDNCCDCYTDTSGLLFPADYLIITYQFDENGGRDLDTRTAITNPLSAGPLGFCDRSNSGEPYIFWSTDNTGTGVESCMIDLTKFGPNDQITINCSALWWNVRNSGDMSLDIKAYEGGTMSLEGYQFVNDGGVQ
jgi:hypothetical protein